MTEECFVLWLLGLIGVAVWLCAGPALRDSQRFTRVGLATGSSITTQEYLFFWGAE